MYIHVHLHTVEPHHEERGEKRFKLKMNALPLPLHSPNRIRIGLFTRTGNVITSMYIVIQTVSFSLFFSPTKHTLKGHGK